MRYPTRYIIRMGVFLAIIGTLGGLLYAPLKFAFLGNPVINSIILFSLIVGIVFVFRQTTKLLPEYR